MPYDDCQIKLSFVTSSAFRAVFWRPCSSCVEELTWYIVFVLSFSGVQHRGEFGSSFKAAQEDAGEVAKANSQK